MISRHRARRVRPHGRNESEEANGGFQPAARKALDGKLWFPTMKGLVSADPKTLAVHDRPFPVYLEQVKINGRFADPHSPLQVHPGRGDLEFVYTALDFDAPGKILFKYKLGGFDRDWTEAGSRRMAYYTNIPPGNYRFMVIARNAEGTWNSKGATLDLTLEPHFRQTVWFYSLVASSALALLATAHTLRVRQSAQREKFLAERVEQRTRELRKEIEFDLLLTDMQMPEMDGFEIAVAIRKQERQTGRHLPIIAMTAMAMKGDRDRCLQVGMDGYVSKPMQPSELIETVERFSPLSSQIA